MSRCLELAAHGRGNVAPNPMVGAVLVADDMIIGEGFHRNFGDAHAEVNAIAAVNNEALLRRSTMYVNLEPCSHYGKTPPCAELIIRKKIPRVVVACLDPNPEVAGQGIKMLYDAGIEVITGVMEREAIELNRFFIAAHRHQRPYIILKWAQSADGFIDSKRQDALETPVTFSNSLTRMIVHQLRAEVQAIMVGANTALLDNPSLSVRYWPGKAPVRVLVDRSLRVPEDCQLFDGKQQTFIFTTHYPNTDAENKNRRNEKVKYFTIDDSAFQLSEITSILYKNDILSLLVEGGACLHRSFFEENCWNELIIETAPFLLNEGVKSPAFHLYKKAQLIEKQFVYATSPTMQKPFIRTRYKNDSIL